MGDFKKLEAWRIAHALTLDIYRTTAKYPRAELYGLSSQLRRSAGSIPANIAEGCGRNNDVELRRFLLIALGSATELEYHLLLSKDLHLLKEDEFSRLTAAILRVQAMMAGLIRRLAPAARRPGGAVSRDRLANSK